VGVGYEKAVQEALKSGKKKMITTTDFRAMSGKYCPQ
jgi:hypothetical protein